ncbi:hypothetical protein [Flavobacterium lacus]|uniref:Uncharacterized protein n=1 Tax=Flavobacterium lacus TaxID=1353778 RepID=A0A328WZ51_9FLAO|nr:hypothetical protein [Flavobacterium lacus]RAR48498.1 hypothetical protein B0I10_105106 [Flavobacterium lacus]
MKNLFCLTFLFLSTLTFSQQLVYKGNGKISDSNGIKLSPDEVRNIISTNPSLLNLYNEGREKKTIGNVMLIGGATLVVADIAIGATADVKYPTALTYIGVGSLLLSIPVKVGFSNKIKKTVHEHNKRLVYTKAIEIQDFSFITNQNGIGFQITF